MLQNISSDHPTSVLIMCSLLPLGKEFEFPFLDLSAADIPFNFRGGYVKRKGAKVYLPNGTMYFSPGEYHM